MKYSIFIALLGLLLCSIGLLAEQGANSQIPSNKRVAKSHGAAQKVKPDQPKEDQRTATSVPPPVADQIRTEKTDAEADQFKENIEIQRKLVTATNWLVGVGILQAVILFVQAITFFCTLRALIRQTDATEGAAKAALLNAKALINAERPWVMVQIKEVPPETMDDATVVFQIIAFNFGKTPARIVSWKEPTIEAVVSVDKELAVPPDYGKGILQREQFLAPRDSFTIEIVNPFDAQNELLKAGEAARRNVNVKAMRLVFYGQIKYSDGVSPDLHETRFCYMHVDGGGHPIGGELILSGPREYNLWT